jgi:hypothetical protein
MRHPKTDAMELQLEALLRSAAAFEPEHDAPFDLVERAMQRATRNIAVVRIQRPVVTLLWGSAAGAAAASAAAAILISSPPATNEVPLRPLQASLGAVAPAYRVSAEQMPDLPSASPQPRRTLRVRRSTPRPCRVVEEPAPKVAWQTEEFDRTVERVVRPGLRFQIDDQGFPVEVEAGLLETLSVTETPAACGTSDATGTGESDHEMSEISGDCRAKEADLPSEED